MWQSLCLWLGGERNRYKEFRFRFRHCRYRNSGRKKNGKFVILWIDFREDIFPVHFYSESESNSLKSIQRITNFLVFFLPDILYRHCRNRNTNSWFLFRSPPTGHMMIVQVPSSLTTVMKMIIINYHLTMMRMRTAIMMKMMRRIRKAIMMKMMMMMIMMMRMMEIMMTMIIITMIISLSMSIVLCNSFSLSKVNLQKIWTDCMDIGQG